MGADFIQVRSTLTPVQHAAGLAVQLFVSFSVLSVLAMVCGERVLGGLGVRPRQGTQDADRSVSPRGVCYRLRKIATEIAMRPRRGAAMKDRPIDRRSHPIRPAFACGAVDARDGEV